MEPEWNITSGLDYSQIQPDQQKTYHRYHHWVWMELYPPNLLAEDCGGNEAEVEETNDQ